MLVYSYRCTCIYNQFWGRRQPPPLPQASAIHPIQIHRPLLMLSLPPPQPMHKCHSQFSHALRVKIIGVKLTKYKKERNEIIPGGVGNTWGDDFYSGMQSGSKPDIWWQGLLIRTSELEICPNLRVFSSIIHFMYTHAYTNRNYFRGDKGYFCLPCHTHTLDNQCCSPFARSCIMCTCMVYPYRGIRFSRMTGQVAGRHFEGGVIQYAARFQGNMVLSPVPFPFQSYIVHHSITHCAHLKELE